MAPTLKQTIQDQINKGNIHVEKDKASTSKQAAGMGKRAGKKFIIEKLAPERAFEVELEPAFDL